VLLTSTELFSPLVLPSGGTLHNRIAKAAMEEGMPGAPNSPTSG
jgi:2,4-dienoyl-CoA reductase-like NADH-dependent reductase (Old Yellow Enzyme family)